jgi:hypothetical protein
VFPVEKEALLDVLFWIEKLKIVLKRGVLKDGSGMLEAFESASCNNKSLRLNQESVVESRESMVT